jgi:hypothetical protein
VTVRDLNGGIAELPSQQAYGEVQPTGVALLVDAVTSGSILAAVS